MKTVLITGASSGIGEATAKYFAKKGYLTLINYNTGEERALKIKEDILKEGNLAEIFEADVSNFNAVEKMFDAIYKKYKKIDVLVNNAGISSIKEFTKTTEKDFDSIINTNLKSVYLCCKKALESMLKYSKGSIVNISSMWGVVGGSYEVIYSASKAAIIGLSKALAKEVGGCGVRVNVVAPGFIDTPMNAEINNSDRQRIIEETPLYKVGESEDIAKAIFFLAGEDSKFITGETLNVSGGLII